jgi:hypothetical protein
MSSKWKTGKYLYEMLVPKPKVPKTASEKRKSVFTKERRKALGKQKKEHQDTMNKLFREGDFWRRSLQKQLGKKVTKHGFSKGKDLPSGKK